MKTIMLAAGAAAIALSSGLALAQTVPGPKQPIPYDQLSAYMKASPKQRAAKNWWAGQSSAAQTGTGANTSATAAVSPSLPADTSSAATSVNPPAASETKEAAPQSAINPPAPDAVNPSPTATPGAPDSTTPPK